MTPKTKTWKAWYYKNGVIVHYTQPAVWEDLPGEGLLAARVEYDDGAAEVFANRDYVSRKQTDGEWEWANFREDPGGDERQTKKGVWLRPDEKWEAILKTICEGEATLNKKCGYRDDQPPPRNQVVGVGAPRRQIVGVDPMSAGAKKRL